MPGVLSLTKSVAPDNDRFMFRSDQKHIKMNLFGFSTKRTMKKVCYFYPRANGAKRRAGY